MTAEPILRKVSDVNVVALPPVANDEERTP
jgi:hypothetical protein